VKKLTDEQIKAAAEAAGLEYAMLKAVAVVESSGDGFLPDGRPKILFEGHIFWKQLKAQGLDPAKFVRGNEDVLYQTWTKVPYKGGAAEYPRLEKAEAIDRDAALRSASWGLFQVMGFNWSLCGFDTLQNFIDAMYRDEAGHLEACLGYIKGAGLIQSLKRLAWGAFAKGYNGPGYAANQYDVKLARAYTEAQRKAW
jgi:hypothetical protein